MLPFDDCNSNKPLLRCITAMCFTNYVSLVSISACNIAADSKVLISIHKLYPEKWTQDFATTPDCRQRIRNVDKQSA